MSEENKPYLELLKKALCEAVNRPMNCASDFVFLQAFIFERTHENLGLNTLKRLWSYGNAFASPRTYTLDILAQTIGYRNFEELKLHYGDEGSESSDRVLSKHVQSKDLRPGDRVTICWLPGRRCVVEYLGNETFRILESENTKLKPGNTFQTAFFVVGSPMLLSNLVQEGSSASLYEIGRNGGITQIMVDTKQ
ncbi:MAG: hypothetical protein K6A41_10160 [Bacteroidales bacterium]|nr:hypothetical protein [Bacteroidales bacterium]